MISAYRRHFYQPFRDIIEIPVGKRYSKEEFMQINALVAEGLTNEDVATRLGRSEAAIRGIRFRKKMKACANSAIMIEVLTCF
jgi:DNA-binding NarL/FixJ family response regulator